MNQIYLDTARLLTQVAPLVFVGDTFALKGGTAINLFVRDMPLNRCYSMRYSCLYRKRLGRLMDHSNGRKSSTIRQGYISLSGAKPKCW